MEKINWYEKKYIIFLSLVIYTILFILFNGYFFGVYDHSFMLPFIFKYMDSTLFPNDLLLTTFHNTYTFFTPLMAFLGKFISLKILFFVLYFISMYCLFLGFFKITQKIFNTITAYFSLIILYSGLKFYIGGSPLFTNMFVQFNIALPLLIWAIYYFLKEKYLYAFILLGIAFDFHAMATTYILFYIFIYLLLDYKRINFKKLILPAAISLIIALPVVIWILKDMGGNYPKEWFNIIRINQGHHAFPSRFPLITWLKFGIVIFIAIFFNKYNWNEKKHKFFISSYIGFGILAIIGTIFTEIIPIAAVVKAQLFRACKIPMLFVFIMFSGYLINLIYEEKKNLFMIISISLFLLLQFNIALFIALILLLLSRHIKTDINFITALLFLIGSFLAIKFNNIFDIGVKFSVVIFLVYLSLRLFKNKLKNIVPIILIGLFLVYFFIPRYRSTLLAMKKFQYKIALEKWVNKHTNKNDLFFVDPSFYSFRVFSKRSCFVTWGEGTRAFFNVPFALEWWKRVNLLGIYNKKDVKKFSINKEKLTSIHKIYPFNYIVVKKNIKLSYPVIYHNKEYFIYKWEKILQSMDDK